MKEDSSESLRTAGLPQLFFPQPFPAAFALLKIKTIRNYTLKTLFAMTTTESEATYSQQLLNTYCTPNVLRALRSGTSNYH